jgi:uncharacterized protein YegL
METVLNIPASSETQEIIQIRFTPGQKRSVIIFTVGGEQKSVSVDFQSVVDGATATQKATVKQFFKWIATAAFNKLNENAGITVAEGDIVGDLFDDV